MVNGCSVKCATFFAFNQLRGIDAFRGLFGVAAFSGLAMVYPLWALLCLRFGVPVDIEIIYVHDLSVALQVSVDIYQSPGRRRVRYYGGDLA